MTALFFPLHPHNDRGCGVADAELAVLAGAQRIEGTPVRQRRAHRQCGHRHPGHEHVQPRRGPGPGFQRHARASCEMYERVHPHARLRAHALCRRPGVRGLQRQPSGRHRQGHELAQGKANCTSGPCPYIPIDPHDIGRTYDADVIRINSQSRQGRHRLPAASRTTATTCRPKMREDLGYRVKDVSDHEHRELSVKEVLYVFESSLPQPQQPARHPRSTTSSRTRTTRGHRQHHTVGQRQGDQVLAPQGNGRLDAVATAIEQQTGMHFTLISLQRTRAGFRH